MASAMFHVKQLARPGKRGFLRGLDGSGILHGLARTGLKRAGAGLGLMLGAALAGCSAPADSNAAAGVAQAAVPPAPPAPPAAAATPGAVVFTDNDQAGEAKRAFSYIWPAAVSAVPALTGRFSAERDGLLAGQKADWAEALREFAGSDCAGCVMRDFQKEWAVVADLPRFLSLSASFYEYTGGAHGNGAHDALVWDREAEAALDPKAMFTTPAALQDALGAAWCKALKAQRQERLGDGYSDDGFFQCPPIADLTVLVGSSDKRSFNRIGLLAAPYVAGSYAEGTYEVTLPVTPAVLAAVKPAYRAAFTTEK